MEYTYLLLACVFVCANGCTEFPSWVRDKLEADPDATDSKKVFYSHRVLFATVLELKPDPVFKREGVKAAALDVICIYKGGLVPKSITVLGAGNLKGELEGCPAVHLEPGQSYVFFLNNQTGRHYEIEFEPLGGDPTIILDDLTIYCGLELKFPAGLPKNDECYEPIGEEYCEAYKPETTTTQEPPPTTVKTVTKATPKEDEVHVKDNNGNNPGYDTKNYNNDNKSNGGKASGSKDNPNSGGSEVVLTWTLISFSLILALL